MTRIVFRQLPAVAEVERQLALHARDRLLDDEVEELPRLIDEASAELFGITRRDTLYWALPEPIRAQFTRDGWEENFDFLGYYSREPNAAWRVFDLDLCCEEGRSLHCLEVFGRQLVCAVRGLHPQAVLAFARPEDGPSGLRPAAIAAFRAGSSGANGADRSAQAARTITETFMTKALPLALAAALLAAAGPASAQTAGDIRCIVVSNAFATAAKDENQKKAAESALYFYLGRIGDGMAPTRLKALLDTETKALSDKTAGAEMDKCVTAIQAKIKMMQDLAPPAAQQPQGR